MSSDYDGFRRSDPQTFFLTDGEIEAQRGKVTLLVIGRAKTTTQFLILSLEIFSSHKSTCEGLYRGETLGLK